MIFISVIFAFIITGFLYYVVSLYINITVLSDKYGWISAIVIVVFMAICLILIKYMTSFAEKWANLMFE
jgi:hypothetical protein